MKRITKVLQFVSAFCCSAYAQQQFECAIGGFSSDYAGSVVQTPDGNFVVAGSTLSFGSGFEDMYFVKIDTNGWVQWSWTLGASATFEGIYGMIVTSDSGLALTGFTTSGNRIIFIKTDKDGSLFWSKRYGPVGYVSQGYGLQQTSDGGYVVCGLTSGAGAGGNDAYLIRISSGGTCLWSKTYGGINNESANHVAITSDGGYILSGYSESFPPGSAQMYLIKTDSIGNSLWAKTYGTGAYGPASKVKQTSDGGYIAFGYTQGTGSGLTAFCLIRTDADGNLLWVRAIEETGDTDQPYGFDITPDGKYIGACSIASSDAYLFKADDTGNILWAVKYGGSGAEGSTSVAVTKDGGIILAGYTESFGAGMQDIYVIKTDSTGLTGCNNSWVTPQVVVPNFSTVSGVFENQDCSMNNFLLAFDQPASNDTILCGAITNTNGKFSGRDIRVYPNPVCAQLSVELPPHGYSSLSIEISNTLGHQILRKIFEGSHLSVDFSGQPSGIYFLKVISGGNITVKKIVRICSD